MVALPFARPAGRLLAKRVLAPPRRRHHRSPDDLGMPFVDDTVVTADGIALHVWIVPAAGDARGAAVVGHGVGLTKSASLRQARMLHDAGYAVVMYDHRNHGLSGRDPVRVGMAERFTRDVHATAAFATDRFGRRPVLAYGFSFSAFPSVYALRDSDAIGAVVCDSGPGARLDDLFQGFAAAGALPLPSWLLGTAWGRQAVAACVDRATSLLAGQWPPEAVGALQQTPMLFLVGAQDTIVPPRLVRDLADLYDGARCVVLDGRHLESVKSDEDGYRAALSSFLTELEAAR